MSNNERLLITLPDGTQVHIGNCTQSITSEHSENLPKLFLNTEKGTKMEKIYTKNAPEALGPYTQAMKVGNLVFTSGQIPINPKSSLVEAEGIEVVNYKVDLQKYGV